MYACSHLSLEDGNVLIGCVSWIILLLNAIFNYIVRFVFSGAFMNLLWYIFFGARKCINVKMFLTKCVHRDVMLKMKKLNLAIISHKACYVRKLRSIFDNDLALSIVSGRKKMGLVLMDFPWKSRKNKLVMKSVWPMRITALNMSTVQCREASSWMW